MSKHPPKRGVHEDPHYSIPDRHSEGGAGVNREGNQYTDRVYRQPWVEHDGVTDPNGDAKIG